MKPPIRPNRQLIRKRAFLPGHETTLLRNALYAVLGGGFGEGGMQREDVREERVFEVLSGTLLRKELSTTLQ